MFQNVNKSWSNDYEMKGQRWSLVWKVQRKAKAPEKRWKIMEHNTCLKFSPTPKPRDHPEEKGEGGREWNRI